MFGSFGLCIEYIFWLMVKILEIFSHIIPHLSYIINQESRRLIGNFLRYNCFLCEESLLIHQSAHADHWVALVCVDQHWFRCCWWMWARRSVQCSQCRYTVNWFSQGSEPRAGGWCTHGNKHILWRGGWRCSLAIHWFFKLHLDVQLSKRWCQETPLQVFVPTLVLEWWHWCPLGHVGGSGTYPSSNN